MSKIIKPLLNADGTQVRRPIKVGEYYYSFSWDEYEQCKESMEGAVYPIYYAEQWYPYENEKYYYYNLHLSEAIRTFYSENDLFHKMNIKIGNCFRTKEEAEQADIQQILDNLKEYYKNKEGK